MGFLVPQSTSDAQVTILMSDRGIPKDYRHMDGFSSHTLSLWNKNGERFWIKWHFKTMQGIENLSNDESAALTGSDPDHAQQDLIEAIEKRVSKMACVFASHARS